MARVFMYGAEETEYLKRRDKRLGRVIDRLGHIQREVQPELFPAVVNSIVGQQISTKAQRTVWERLVSELGEVNAERVLAAGREGLQRLGMTFRKADYITDFALKVQSGEVELTRLAGLPDDEFVAELSQLRGVGVWTAEMIQLFCLQRPDVFSYGDLAILRGLRMVYRHRDISRERFEVYRRRFSPCCSVASLYLWAVAGGALPELTDPAARTAGSSPGKEKKK